MNTLRILKKLLLGETWLLPLGITAVVAAAALVIRPAAPAQWEHVGGFVLLGGVLGVLVLSVAGVARQR